MFTICFIIIFICTIDVFYSINGLKLDTTICPVINNPINKVYYDYAGATVFAKESLKYLADIDYNKKKEDILKFINHTIIVLYNASTIVEYNEDELKKIEKYNKDFNTFEKAFGCYELFNEKYKGIKLFVDLDNDKSNINLIFPSIKDKLFNLENDIFNIVIMILGVPKSLEKEEKIDFLLDNNKFDRIEANIKNAISVTTNIITADDYPLTVTFRGYMNG